MPTETEQPNDLVSRREFEIFSKTLDDKTTHIAKTLDGHEVQIDSLNDSIQDVKKSIEYLESSFTTGINNLNTRIDDISTYLLQSSSRMEESNRQANSNRDSKLEEHLNRQTREIKDFMTKSDEQVKYAVKKVDELDDALDNDGEKRRSFWINVITIVVGVIVAIINILPALLSNK